MRTDKRIYLKNVMKMAHKIAKTMTGNYSARLKYAIKKAYEIIDKVQGGMNGKRSVIICTEFDTDKEYVINADNVHGFIHYLKKHSTELDNIIVSFEYKSNSWNNHKRLISSSADRLKSRYNHMLKCDKYAEKLKEWNDNFKISHILYEMNFEH